MKCSLTFISVVVFIKFQCFQLSSTQKEYRDVILSPYAPIAYNRKFAYFYPKFNNTGRSIVISKVPWEEPLKESANLALSSDTKISKSSLLKAPYIGFVDLKAPKFGDIVMLAKGKLKQNHNCTFFFEQINENCNHCQQNADQYLESVKALWMVERIRHIDAERGHRYDLKFTILPVYHDLKSQLTGNMLETHLWNQSKRTFILRDLDYPKYFQAAIPPTTFRRADLFASNFERSISNIKIFNPNNLMQQIFGLKLPPSSNNQQTSNMHSSQTRINYNQHRKGNLNMKEMHMQAFPELVPKYQNHAYSYFVPTVGNHIYGNPHLGHPHSGGEFPDLREGNINKSPYAYQNVHKKSEQKTESNTFKDNLIDHRGAIDNVNVGKHTTYQSKDSLFKLPALNSNKQNNIYQIRAPNIYVPALVLQSQHFEVPVVMRQMPFVQYAHMPYDTPPQIQLSAPSDKIIFPQSDITTFRYQMQPIINTHNSHSQASPPLQFPPKSPNASYQQDYNFIKFPDTNTEKTKEKSFQESERHVTNHFSYPDSVYYPTESPVQPYTYIPNPNRYRFLIKPEIENPISTTSSNQVNTFKDNGFQPMNPPYKILPQSENKLSAQVKQNRVELILSTKKPDSISSQLTKPENEENVTIPYVPFLNEDTYNLTYNKHNASYEPNYDVIVPRATYSQKATEISILKWKPRKYGNKIANLTAYTSSTTSLSSFVPTMIPTKTAQLDNSPTIRASTRFYRGRNKFNSRRNQTSSTGTSTISPLPQITKLFRKQPRLTTLSQLLSNMPSTVEKYSTPTYVTPETTDEPFTLQSFSTSIGLDKNVKHICERTTEIPSTFGYELISAGVESINTNSSNIKI